MRVVDVNVVGERPPGMVEEAWVVEERTRREDPARLPFAPARAAGAARIRPQLVTLPGPLGELELRVTVWRAAGAPAALRICPGPHGHGYPMEDWVLSPLPEYCEREELCLVVDPGGPAADFPWSDVVRLARDHPGLPIVAVGAPLAGPTAGRALDAAPNLVLETSACTEEADVAAVAELARGAGSHRLVYGSGGATGPTPERVAARLGPDAAAAVLAGTADLLGRGAWREAWL